MTTSFKISPFAMVVLVAGCLTGCADTGSSVCASGRVCPANWQCAADQDICIDTSCGNGTRDNAESCDDGNVIDGDGCSGFCELEIYPYVQRVTPQSAHIMWTVIDGRESSVDWGNDPYLGIVETASNPVDHGDALIHEVVLNGLTPGSEYYYSVVSGDVEIGPYRFQTPTTAPERFRLAVLGNMRGDWERYSDIAAQRLLEYLATEPGVDPETLPYNLANELAMVLLPGNFIAPNTGDRDWLVDFFQPGAALMAQVPFYPVFGDVESRQESIGDYFRLPQNNDSSEFPGRWWSLDHGNVRIIGLDSTLRFQAVAQRQWLEQALQGAIDNPAIDFAIVQVHHLFAGGGFENSGELITREIINALDDFSDPAREGGYLPIVHLTASSEHGYVRGQSLESAHVWVDVSAAGGPISPLEERPEGDPNIISVEQSEHGFVIIDVEAGESPSLRVRRIASDPAPDGPMDGMPPDMGDDLEIRPRDEVVIRAGNTEPVTPTGLAPIAAQVIPECARLDGSEFSDPDGDTLFAAAWQISDSCADPDPFGSNLVLERTSLGGQGPDGGPRAPASPRSTSRSFSSRPARAIAGACAIAIAACAGASGRSRKTLTPGRAPWPKICWKILRPKKNHWTH